jgi:GxxExxY protein
MHELQSDAEESERTQITQINTDVFRWNILDRQLSMDMQELNSITRSIIGASFQVLNTLGPNFLEKVYENALAYELKKRGHKLEQQKQLAVYYDNQINGQYSVDLFVDDLVPVELKALREIHDSHIAQALNELKCSRQKLGLVLNFGTRELGIKRVINSYDYPELLSE